MRGISFITGLILFSAIPAWSQDAAPAVDIVPVTETANGNEILIQQIQGVIGVELDPGARALVEENLNKVIADETREGGQWYVLTCGGGQGGLMPVLPVGGQGAVCVDFSGRSFWLAGLNVGLIGGGSAQLGAIVLRIYSNDPSGWYWNIQGGSSLAAAGIGVTYGLDFGNGNVLMRVVYAPGVAVDGTVSSFVINKF